MFPESMARIAGRMGLHVDRMEPGVWLVQRNRGGRRYRLRRIGDEEARTHLVYNRKAARAKSQHLQRQLGEFLLREQLMSVIDEIGINCVLDVGANVGQYGRRLRRSGYHGRLVSFEPLAEFADKLKARAEKDLNWHVHQYALGDEDTTAEINATPGRSLSSLLEPSDFGKGWSEGLAAPTRTTIAVRRLDSVLDEVTAGLDDPRILLKLDTQGYDLVAVRGAGDRLKEVLALQSEVAWLRLYEGMPILEEQLAVYREAGFDISGMYPVGRHLRTLRVIEMDVLMVRPEAFARRR